MTSESAITTEISIFFLSEYEFIWDLIMQSNENSGDSE